MSLPAYADYKDSGVLWLGRVPSHWDTPRMKVVADLNPSKSDVAHLPIDTELSFLPMEAIGENGELDLSRTRSIAEVSTGYTYFADGDVVFAKVTPCFENGKGALMRDLVGGFGFGTTELTVLRSRKPDDARFLRWLTISRLFRDPATGEMQGAGGLKRVPDAFVTSFKVPWPSASERRAIATFLDRETAKIDALVAEQERLIALLKEKRQAVISHAVTKGLNPNAPMKDSGIEWLGEIPAHWEVVQLRRIISHIEQGWSPECESRPAENGEWGVLKAGCVNRGVYREIENKALPSTLYPVEAFEVRRGDILLSRANGNPELVGSCAYIHETRPNLMLSDKVFRISLLETADPEWFAYVMGASTVRLQIRNTISGADGLANNLPQSALKAFLTPLPPLREQAAIRDQIVTASIRSDSLIVEAQAAITLLQERRAALISAAVTGKIDVRGLVAQTPELETA